jgi:hypothetical protein
MLWIATAVRGAHAHGAPSEFLVFGLGYDSEIWSQVNCGGKTIFLENVQSWWAGAWGGTAVIARGAARPAVPWCAATGRASDDSLAQLTNQLTNQPTNPPTNRIEEVTSKVPGITVYPVQYNTLLEQPEAFFAAPTEPQLPPELESACFDVILVDSPMGWKEFDRQPGRCV